MMRPDWKMESASELLSGRPKAVGYAAWILWITSMAASVSSKAVSAVSVKDFY